VGYIVDMDTTIQISKELLGKLQKMKMHAKESYEDIIWDLLEDRMELSEETKRDLAQYEKDKKAGKLKFKTLEQVKEELGL
jgi:predicted CopG family antitoxin